VALYLFRFAYTPDAWAALIQTREDRRDMLAARLFGTFGGHLHGLWYCFGDCDGYALAELPDTVSAAAVATAVTATGSFRSFETTPLISVDEMLDALARAGDFAYARPGGTA
jgi:uncharacterized protein with GYD domain